MNIIIKAGYKNENLIQDRIMDHKITKVEIKFRITLERSVVRNLYFLNWFGEKKL